MRNSRILLATFGLVSGLFVFGCGSKADPAAASCPTFDYSKYTAPGTPGRTLTTDVEPIIARSCSLVTTCHGSTAAAPSKQTPDLGPAKGAMAADLMKIIMNTVGVTSTQAPAFKYIVAGDPENSYLMKKVEGVASCETPAIACMKVPGQTSPGCGDQMPQLADPLSDGDQAIIRDWIKDGAKQ